VTLKVLSVDADGILLVVLINGVGSLDIRQLDTVEALWLLGLWVHQTFDADRVIMFIIFLAHGNTIEADRVLVF
jgi:hypothetical protein